MYQRPRFLEELHAIREEMSRECDYDLDLFAELIRSGKHPGHGPARNIRGIKQYAPVNPQLAAAANSKRVSNDDAPESRALDGVRNPQSDE